MVLHVSKMIMLAALIAGAHYQHSQQGTLPEPRLTDFLFRQRLQCAVSGWCCGVLVRGPGSGWVLDSWGNQSAVPAVAAGCRALQDVCC
jgi:hypothetical protein